jgi:hypothetical protein
VRRRQSLFPYSSISILQNDLLVKMECTDESGPVRLHHLVT